MDWPPSLDNLSTEVLLKIFKYLDIYQLCKLRQTCKRFNEIIETWGHSFINSVKLLVTNQIHPVIVNRSARLLSPFERLRISRNWSLGIYSEKSMLYSKIKYMPWLQIDKDLIWISRGDCIKAYKRNNRGIDPTQVVYSLNGKTRSEVCRFVNKNNCLLSGQVDGTLWMWSISEERFLFNSGICHENEINSVDLSEDLIITGGRDNWVKIWGKPDETQLVLKCEIDMNDRVWSVALAEDNKSVAIGTAGIAHMSTVTIYDFNSAASLFKMGSQRFGAGVMDIQWDTAFTLWTCGYDAHLRRWDLRTGKCEQALEDPCETGMYCLQYDHLNTIISGTQSNGRVVLWDTRQKNYVQMYFMESCRNLRNSSPVYGLSYDAEFLFTVTDQHLNVLKFSVFNGKFRDYSNLFLKLIKV